MAVKDFPTKSEMLYAVISRSGYQSPRMSDWTFSAKNPGKIDKVTV